MAERQLTPQDRGRDPHTANHRIFRQLQKDLAETNRRLVHNASAVTELAKAVLELRKMVVASPVVMTPDQLRQIEEKVHSCDHLISIARVATTGASAKVTIAQHLTEQGLRMGGLVPQPSLN